MVLVEYVRHRLPAAAKDKKPAPAPRPMSRAEIAAAVCGIKEQARRLRPPLNMHPNAFHEDKSDLVRAIERLEDAIRQNRQLTREPE